MSIPVTPNIEFPFEGIGSDEYPQSIIVKSSLWSLSISGGTFYLKEYEGDLEKITDFAPVQFVLSPALKLDGTFDTDKFWVWFVNTRGQLRMIEMEPFSDDSPVIHMVKEIDSNALSLSVDVKEHSVIRLFVLYNTSPNRDLKILKYNDITQATPDDYSLTPYGPTRLDSLSSYVNDSSTEALIAYLDTASPPGVYTESLTVPVPGNFTASQIGYCSMVDVDWDPSAGSDNYLLQRDTTNDFSTAINAYDGPNNTFNDNVPGSDIYYYRVKAQVTDASMESYWSSTADATVDYVPFLAEFQGLPVSGDANLAVQFTDLSYGCETAASWDWTFGDGTTSTLQNPLHTYQQAGVFDVELASRSSLTDSTEIKSGYITVDMVAEFEAFPTSGGSPLAVNFTDLSLGQPTSWLWDFGDGTTSTDQNPSHEYQDGGSYDVSLDASRGLYSDYLLKPAYITVGAAVADFIIDKPSGYVPITVNFEDISSGSPTTWQWDFGDGTYSTGPQTSHTYTIPGNYIVGMTVYYDTTAYNVYKNVSYATEPVSTPTVHFNRTISGPVRTNIYVKDGIAGIKVTGGSWINLMKRNIPYTGPWKISYTMGTPNADVPHNCVLGRGFASSFLAIADSISGTDRDKAYGINTQRQTVILYNDSTAT